MEHIHTEKHFERNRLSTLENQTKNTQHIYEEKKRKKWPTRNTCAKNTNQINNDGLLVSDFTN